MKEGKKRKKKRKKEKKTNKKNRKKVSRRQRKEKEGKEDEKKKILFFFFSFTSTFLFSLHFDHPEILFPFSFLLFLFFLEAVHVDGIQRLKTKKKRKIDENKKKSKK